MRWGDIKEIVNPTTDYDKNSRRVDRLFHLSRRIIFFCNTAQNTIFGVLILIFVLSNVASLLNISVNQTLQYYAVFPMVYLIVFLVVIGIILTFLNQSLQGLRGLSAVNNNQPFVLFLRSFQAETSILSDLVDIAVKAPIFVVKLALRFIDASLSSLIPLRRRKRDVSYYLPTLSSIPVVSIGAKTTRWGTPKLLMKEDSWEESVQTLIQQASMIVFVPLDTNATVKEFQWVGEDSLAKTIFIMMPKPMTRLMFAYQKRWGAFSNLVTRDACVPSYDKQGSIFLLRNSRALERRKAKKSEVVWGDYYEDDTLAHLISQAERISPSSPVKLKRSKKHADRFKNLFTSQSININRSELPFQ